MIWTKAIWMTILSILCLFIPRTIIAEDLSHFELGARVGVTAREHDESFDLYEVFLISDLPWGTSWSSGWRLTTDFSINAGILEAANDRGLIGSLGPIFVLDKPDSRFRIKLGLKLALLEDDEFGNEELGGTFAFIEDLGIGFRFGGNFEAGYQFRHMSNARIYDNNPGLDLHVFELKYKF